MIRARIMQKNVRIVIEMLKGILEWSDRIGSDEVSEIQEAIKVLENKSEIKQIFKTEKVNN